MDQISPEQLSVLAREDQSQLTKNIVIAFTVLALVSVGLRVFTRLRYKAVGWEDYTIVLAMVSSPVAWISAPNLLMAAVLFTSIRYLPSTT
jgi:hypothetical protein